MPDLLTFADADPGDVEVAALVSAHVERSRRHYPTESDHTLDAEDMIATEMMLFAGWIDAAPVTICGLQPLGDGVAELKSMHTLKAWRGRGLARQLLSHVMREAEARGIGMLYLETGRDLASVAAHRLYRGVGFTECPPFGSYSDDPASLFMCHRLLR